MAVLYFPDSPAWREAGRRMRLALDESGHQKAMVVFIAVDPDATGFAGSPTFTVDGIDLFPGPLAGAPSCRIYPTDDGLSGVPTVAELVAELRKRAG